MAFSFRKLIKGILLGGGSILSLINPAIGAPLIMAGAAIKTDSGTSADIVSVYGSNLYTAIDQVEAMQSGINVNTAINKAILFIQKYFVYIIMAVAAFFILPKLLKNRR